MDHGPSKANPAERLSSLLRMLEAEPGDPFCLYGIAQEHARAGRHREAIGWFDRTITADPAYAYAHFHKAKSLEELGLADDARACLLEGLKSARLGKDRHAEAEIAGYLEQLD